MAYYICYFLLGDRFPSNTLHTLRGHFVSPPVEYVRRADSRGHENISWPLGITWEANEMTFWLSSVCYEPKFDLFVTTSWSFGNASDVTQHQHDVCVPRDMDLERVSSPLMLGQCSV
jgi:hypothetical protein